MTITAVLDAAQHADHADPYAWLITEDLLHHGESLTQEAGAAGPLGAPADLIARLRNGEGEEFTLVDDDENPYMRGRFLAGNGADAELIFAPLLDIGAAYGCTEIRYLNTATGAYVAP